MKIVPDIGFVRQVVAVVADLVVLAVPAAQLVAAAAMEVADLMGKMDMLINLDFIMTDILRQAICMIGLTVMKAHRGLQVLMAMKIVELCMFLLPPR